MEDASPDARVMQRANSAADAGASAGLVDLQPMINRILAGVLWSCSQQGNRERIANQHYLQVLGIHFEKAAHTTSVT